MSAVFNAYDFDILQLPALYRRLNREIVYPDGMTTTLGILYWGREEHLEEIEKALPEISGRGISRFSQLLAAIRTPARSESFSHSTCISKAVLRILAHDIDLWLPRAVPLTKFPYFNEHPDYLAAFERAGLADQLDVISRGQAPNSREALTSETGLSRPAIDGLVRYCDFYRTGRNLEHLRSRIYYEIGMDSYEKWSEKSAELIIATFSDFIRSNSSFEERLIPWPKEVRNGIEWARFHLEIYKVQW